jgi:hypothetical protein
VVLYLLSELLGVIFLAFMLLGDSPCRTDRYLTEIGELIDPVHVHVSVTEKVAIAEPQLPDRFALGIRQAIEERIDCIRAVALKVSEVVKAVEQKLNGLMLVS